MTKININERMPKQASPGEISGHEYPEYAENLVGGAYVAVDKIASLKEVLDRPVIVGLASGTGAGKGYFKEVHLNPELSSRGIAAFMLDGDRYFTGSIVISEGCYQETTFDDPRCVDLCGLSSAMRAIANGQNRIQTPDYDFSLCKRVPGDTYELAGTEVAIVDSIFALSPEIAGHADLTLYIDAPPMQRFLQRLIRDCRERPSIPKRQILPYLIDNYWRHLKFVEGHKNSADIIINGTRDPEDYDGLLTEALNLCDEDGAIVTDDELEIYQKQIRYIQSAFAAG